MQPYGASWNGMKGVQDRFQMSILQAPYSWEPSIVPICSLPGLERKGHSGQTATFLASGPPQIQICRVMCWLGRLTDLAAKCQYTVCVKRWSLSRDAHGVTPNKDNLPYLDFRKPYSPKRGVVLVTDIKH